MHATITKFNGTEDVIVSKGKIDIIVDYATRENKKPGNDVSIVMLSTLCVDGKGWVKVFWSDDAVAELVFDRYQDMNDWLKARKVMKGMTAYDTITPEFSFVI